MNNRKSIFLASIDGSRWQRGLLAFTAMTTLAGCPVNSTAVSDDNLIAEFLVQNDNGQTAATATFSSNDLAGNNDVDLIAGESIFYQRDGQSGELRESSDGEYMISLPSDAAGWYSFTLVRKSEDREQIDREVDDNYVYLPNAFQSVQAQPQQSGSVININWAIDDTTAQSINSFTIDGSEDTFNAIATCQAESGAFDIAITEGELVQQNGLWLLEIPVTQTLAQVTTLTAEAIASASCDFDVQLVRTTIGITDISLNRKSSASGQVLENVSLQWMAQ